MTIQQGQREFFMTTSKETTKTRAASFKTAIKDADTDAKTTPTELSDDDLKGVSGGKHIANIKWTPGRGVT
jgi:hypothetical protein